MHGSIPTAEDLRLELRAYMQAEAQRYRTSVAADPGPCIRFHWPPRGIASEHHVHGSDFVIEDQMEIHGEVFQVCFADTPYGMFGRIEGLWNEAKGATREEIKASLAQAAEPYLARGKQIAELLGTAGRFVGSLESLQPIQMLRLLYARDRDIAREAMTSIETHASLHVFGLALIEILRDRTHPYRRSAQWCVLDLFEDLPSFCTTEDDQLEAIRAIRDLIWDAEDDIVRTIYKAGVVLGGHIPNPEAGDALLECFEAPSKFGRRAVYHASFHLAEWMPHRRAEIVEALRSRIPAESEAVLKLYLESMARDVQREDHDHIADPLFSEEF